MSFALVTLPVYNFGFTCTNVSVLVSVPVRLNIFAISEGNYTTLLGVLSALTKLKVSLQLDFSLLLNELIASFQRSLLFTREVVFDLA